jgi:hypothetical protein
MLLAIVAANPVLAAQLMEKVLANTRWMKRVDAVARRPGNQRCDRLIQFLDLVDRAEGDPAWVHFISEEELGVLALAEIIMNMVDASIPYFEQLSQTRKDGFEEERLRWVIEFLTEEFFLHGLQDTTQSTAAAIARGDRGPTR